jgi:hypothetical protein
MNMTTYVFMSSFELSSTFDFINIEWLIKRLRIVGLPSPSDLIKQITEWLKESFFYVNIDGVNSILYDILLGAIQGSVLGPILYDLFATTMFDL